MIDSIATALVFMLFMYMIRGVIEWVFRGSPLRRTTVLYKDPDAIIRPDACSFKKGNKGFSGIAVRAATCIFPGTAGDITVRRKVFADIDVSSVAI